MDSEEKKVIADLRYGRSICSSELWDATERFRGGVTLATLL
jgi:hypothetical protein